MDAREIHHKWYDSFDQRTMTIHLEPESAIKAGIPQELPAEFEVCDLCNGTGKCVNPSIDRHGLSSDDFDDDPDFRENYFSGMYDIPCPQCRGNRVVPWPCYDNMKPEIADKIKQFIADYFADQREQWYERERGY